MQFQHVNRAAASLLLISLTLFMCACAGSPNSNPVSTNPAPSLSSVNPNSILAGSTATTITLTGSNFISSSTVMWNGAALTTSYTNATTLTAQVPATDLANAGTATVTVVNPGPGGGTSSGVTVTAANPVPTLTLLTPNTAAAGSAAITLTATGTNFIPTSTIMWHGASLTTSYTNSTTLTAQVPSADLTTTGTASITVSNPSPGGGTSGSVNFTISGTTIQVVSILANDLAWDPVNQVIYLSLPSTDSPNGNSVQILNPTTATLGTAVVVGSEPNLLAVSATSQFLYVSQNGASAVQVLSLPSLASSSTITLGSDPTWGPFYAMDLQAAPNADGTVAVVQGTPSASSSSNPREEGGVWIYDSGVARTNVICGWNQTGCPNPNNYLMDSIQWNATGSEMSAVNYETSSFDFYTVPVSTSGFGTPTDYLGVASGYLNHLHYDAPTGYVYSDCGCVINPSTGINVGSFGATGLLVPDGNMGVAFILGQISSQIGTTNYTVESFNISTFSLMNTMTFSNVTGAPTAFIRWGSNGLAFTTVDNTQSPPVGAVYIVNGPFVSYAAARQTMPPTENVQRTWKPRDAFHVVHSAETGAAETK